MKRLHAFVSLVVAVVGTLASVASSAQASKEKSAPVPLTKAELFAPRFRATGSFLAVQLLPTEGKRGLSEKVLRDFGAGALAEKEAYSFVATLSGTAPVVLKRVLKHYRCPKRSDDGGGPGSDVDCQPVKIRYVLPADPTDATALAECGVTVDADVLYLGRRAKTIKWILDPPSPIATSTGGAIKPRIRLIELGYDSSGQEVRGITFSDDTNDPQERGDPPVANPKPVFEAPATTADGQSVVWTRIKGEAGLAKVFYYAVVLQLWSDSLQDYVFCAPYDPTIGNRGN